MPIGRIHVSDKVGKIRFRYDKDSRDVRIFLEDFEITELVYSYTLSHVANEPPRVTLELVAHPEIPGEVLVMLDVDILLAE